MHANMVSGDHSRRVRACRRRQALRALGVAGAGGLGGCGTLPNWLGTTRSQSVELEFLEVAGARSEATFDPVVTALNERFDREIELAFTEIPYENMRSQLQTRVGGGDPPDVATIDQIWLGSFVDAGTLLPLPDVAADLDLDDYLDPFVDVATSDGTLYALPTTTDVRGMYWNREAFAAVGLDPDTPPETWSELFEFAERLHDPPERYGATMFVVGGRWTVPLFAAGGRVLSPDGTEPRFQREPGVRAARFLDELFNERAVGPPTPPYQDGAGLAREFLRGQHAITIVEGSWLDYFWRNLGNEDTPMSERFGFAATPRPAGGERATMSGGHLWAGFEGTDHPDVVREFMRVAGGRAFKRHLSVETGQIPTRESLQDDPAVWDTIDYGDTVRDLLADTHLRPIRNWSVVAQHLDPALQRVAFDEVDAETALSDVASAVRSDIA